MIKNKSRRFCRLGSAIAFGQPKQKGVSLIITFFIMIIILASVLSVSVLLYGQAKVLRNMGNSVSSLYTADSGIEKILYYDRQVIPAGAKRGLCSIFDQSRSITQYCQASGSFDSSVLCTPDVNPDPSGSNCNYNDCTNCTISFKTFLDNGNYYTTTATVSPDGINADLVIMSKGIAGSSGAGRQMKISITTPQ